MHVARPVGLAVRAAREQSICVSKSNVVAVWGLCHCPFVPVSAPSAQCVVRMSRVPGVRPLIPSLFGALPVVAAAAALLRRLRLAIALAVAILLKVGLEAVAQEFVQRGRPAQALPDVILRGQSAARGLSCPSDHPMVIFAIAALVAVSGLWRLAAATFLKAAIPVRPRPAIGSCAGPKKPGVELSP